jgi:hypothetical protein
MGHEDHPKRNNTRHAAAENAGRIPGVSRPCPRADPYSGRDPARFQVVAVSLFVRFGVPSFVSTLAGLLTLLGMQLSTLAASGTADISFTLALPKFSLLPTAHADRGIRVRHEADLRHTAAALAVSAGANVKAVQRMLGHASVAMILDVYADLFDDDLDAVAAALNHQATNTDVGKRSKRPNPLGQEKGPTPRRSREIGPVAPTGVDPVTSRFSVERSTN